MVQLLPVGWACLLDHPSPSFEQLQVRADTRDCKPTGAGDELLVEPECRKACQHLVIRDVDDQCVTEWQETDGAEKRYPECERVRQGRRFLPSDIAHPKAESDITNDEHT